MSTSSFTRRSLFTIAAASATPLLAKKKKIPVGLEMYSVRDQMKDVIATTQAVAKLGYEGVEYYGPYYDWTPDFAKQVRKALDDLGIKCYSTHNSPKSFTPEGIPKAIELNTILGSKYIVMASAGQVQGVDGWKKVAEALNGGAMEFKKAGIEAGYHNHQLEWKPVDGQKPLEIIAANTGKDVMLQLDVGTCVETGNDPVAWILKNKGRVRSIHCKEWAKKNGYKALFGEGDSPWKQIFKAAEKNGIQYYLIEQEGSQFSSLETVERCLKSFRELHG